MPRLAVNVDHVAAIRQARKTFEPDPVIAASLAELAGADGIIVHLREDRRHIQDRDLLLLRKTVTTKLNLEMAATEEMIDVALEVRPDMVTLVPEKREELTTEGGLDVAGREKELAGVVQTLKAGGIRVSLFVDPSGNQVAASQAAGTDIVEIHTGHYAEARGREEAEKQFYRVVWAAREARKLGFEVSVGHGLTYQNVKKFKGVSEISEFSIGHSIISRAVLVGMDRAVREMLALIKGTL
jgi:pyridoxine 5-phosphate synthase